MRMLFAFEKEGKFHMSFFRDMKKPSKIFSSKDELETEARRRGCTVQWLNQE